METTVKHLASRVDADERTLRRAVEQGTVRCLRTSPRRVELDVQEEHYLLEHWPLLRQLRATLRTEPNVRLAVLFGSLARGDGRTDSDVDLLVDLVDDAWERRQQLASRLERAVGRPIELAVLSRVCRHPSLLMQVLDDGRVVVDRGGRWAALKRRRPSIRRAAREEQGRLEIEARAAFDELVGG
jgi:predicted nucleotidyltransferase